MICPTCNRSFWRLFPCPDGVHRCGSCAKAAPPIPPKPGRPADPTFTAPPPSSKQKSRFVPRPTKLHEGSHAWRRLHNLCVRCGAKARYYGTVGGYGIHCDSCADEVAQKSRERSARAREAAGLVPTGHARYVVYASELGKRLEKSPEK